MQQKHLITIYSESKKSMPLWVSDAVCLFCHRLYQIEFSCLGSFKNQIFWNFSRTCENTAVTSAAGEYNLIKQD